VSRLTDNGGLVPAGTKAYSELADSDLRACVHGLVALTAMPVQWNERSPRAIAERACDLLAESLHIDVAYVRVHAAGSDAPQAAVLGAPLVAIEAALQEVALAPDSAARPIRVDHDDLRLVALPIGSDGEIGTIAAGSRRANFPNQADWLLLQATAKQLAIALPHAALLRHREAGEQQLRARAAEQAAVAELGFRALSGLSIGQLIADALDVVRRTLHVEMVELFELAPDAHSLLLRAGAGCDTGAVGQARVNAGLDSQAGYTLRHREPVVVDDLRTDTRFLPPPILIRHGAISGIMVMIHGERAPYGILGAHARELRHFTPDDAHFLQSIAHLLAVALQRARAEAEREGLLRQMGRAIAARDRAVDIVSHDLGNPLSTIQVCAAALLDPEPPSPDGVHHMAQIIQRATTWMRQIVQDLLDRASLDAGRLVLHLQPTAVADVLGVAHAILAPVAVEQAVELVMEAAPDLPAVSADPRRLLQVLTNLISNAIKFTPAGGRVVATARVAPGEVRDLAAAADRGCGIRFEVSDSGCGIAPEDLAHVFDWYWHSEREGRTGTGLGLAIAGGLVEAHHGRLHVESTPGRGSRFWFTIPAAAMGSPPDARS
jgi:signal transduction histidine kinase